MSTNKTIKTRISHKHDIEENWNMAVNFKPLAGELIIYDPDSTHPYSRFKIGDGETSVSSLPFAFHSKEEIDSLEIISVADIDAICGTTIQVAIDNEVTF